MTDPNRVSYLVRVVQRHACFGLVVDAGTVTRAAPIAGWSIGRRGRDVVAYYRSRGAEVSWTEIT